MNLNLQLLILIHTYRKYVCRTFKIAFVVASQENAKNLQKMPEFTKAPKVKKCPKLCKNYNIDLCFQLRLIFFHVIRGYFMNEILEFSSLCLAVIRNYTSIKSQDKPMPSIVGKYPTWKT